MERLKVRRECVQQVLGLIGDCLEVGERMLTLAAGWRRFRGGGVAALDADTMYTPEEVAKFLKISPAEMRDLLTPPAGIPHLRLQNGSRRILGGHVLEYLAPGADDRPHEGETVWSGMEEEEEDG